MCLSQARQIVMLLGQAFPGTTMLESFTFPNSSCRGDQSGHHSHPRALVTPSVSEEHCDWCFDRGRDIQRKPSATQMDSGITN